MEEQINYINIEGGVMLKRDLRSRLMMMLMLMS